MKVSDEFFLGPSGKFFSDEGVVIGAFAVGGYFRAKFLDLAEQGNIPLFTFVSGEDEEALELAYATFIVRPAADDPADGLFVEEVHEELGEDQQLVLELGLGLI